MNQANQPERSASCKVLIVGAGPTGLACAAALVKSGVACRIIDKNKGRSINSKALGVQAGTLECLKSAIGTTLVAEMVRCGQAVREAYLHLYENPPEKINLGTIPSEFNFILILPQSETERILENYLNQNSVYVERETELLSSHEQNGKVVVQLKHAEQGGDRWSEAAADFLIGADGAHSRVRKELAVPFKGGAYDGDFVLGDVKISWPWDYGSIHTFVSERGVVAAFPMPGERQYRLILIPSEKKVTAAGPVNASTKSFTKSSPKSSTDISIEDFESIVTRISDGKIRVEAFTWLTRFTVHHRMVTKYQVGRQFLAGDAAHIHSPVGGQGMNTGIQDALNLACKIKSVLTGQSSIESLSDYEKERSPVARGVLRGTDFVFRMALLPNQRIVGLLRRHLLPAVVRNRWLQKRAVVAISEIKQARKEILNYQILNTDARVGTPV